MGRNKIIHKITAMLLSAIMVAGMMPVSVLAETDVLPLDGEIIAFEKLDADIATQRVPLGTTEADLALPETLLATIKLAVLGEETMLDSGETDLESQGADTVEDSVYSPEGMTSTAKTTFTKGNAALDSDETNSEPDSSDTVSGSVIGIDEMDDIETGEESEIASPSDAQEDEERFEAEPMKKTVDSTDEITVPLPVAWTSSPEYDDETAGKYIFTPELSEGITLASGMDAPRIIVTVAAMAGTGQVTAFDAFPDDLRWQNTTTPQFPETVDGTVAGKAAQIPVTWEADHDYDGESPQRGLYVFTAVLGQGYGVADGVELPRMTVYIPQTVGRMVARMAGGGTTDSPLEITTAAQLAEIAALVNAHENGLERFLFNDADARVTLELQNDIDLSAYSGEEGWTPIGTYDEDTGESRYFTGTFDGNNYSITGLTIKRSNGFEQGLFGAISSGSVVKNLGIMNADITGKMYIGGVVGAVDIGGMVQGCYVTGTVSGEDSVGGVAGSVGGIVENCYSTGSISGTNYSVGGVAGEVYGGTVQNCYSTCAISGGNDAGGMVGTVDGGIVQGCAALNPTVAATNDVGRVAGYAEDSILSGNIALAGMDCTSDGSNYDDGTSATASEIKAAGFFETLFETAAVWTYAEGKLPGFGTAAPMPSHIVDGSDTNFRGAGISENPYQIKTAGDLAQLASLVNVGDTTYNDKYYKLMNDLDLSDHAGGEGWIPIGDDSNSFKGIFDGGGHKVGNLTIDRSGADYQGLFGCISGGSTVKELGVVNTSITGYSYVGGVVGYMASSGLVENCYSTGSVTGNGLFVGGLAGTVAGTMENCYSTIKVISSGSFVGGAVGTVTGTVENCYSTGNVTGVNFAGGIAGSVDGGALQNCAALNSSVSGTNFVWRVSGDDTALSDNIAFSGMTVMEDGSSKTIDEGANRVDGLSKTIAEISAEGFFEALFAGDTAWSYAAGKLPGFGMAVPMPDHLIPVGASPFAGAGTEENPYLIQTAADLSKLAELVNSDDEATRNAYNSKYYKLINDLDLSGYADGDGWNPIGMDTLFWGTFDGDGHKISNLTINRNADYQGLFGLVSSVGIVKNIGVVNANVIGKNCVGGVAGYVWGATVENSFVSGSISGAQRVGGVAGCIYNGTVQNCYSIGRVGGLSEVGGVAGTIMVGDAIDDGTVQNCYSICSVTGRNSNVLTGGVVGAVKLYSSVKNCVALNPSVSEGTYNFGRVVGGADFDALSNNYAFSCIPGTWENKGSGAKDGMDVTSQTLFGDSFWTTADNWDTAAWDSSIWTFEDDKLPILTGIAGQSGEGGLYLTARDIQYASVTPDESSFTYNGSEQRPTLTVTFDGETLVKDTDYTVAVTSTDGGGASAGTNVGEVTLTLTGMGSFAGTKNLTYTIDKKSVIITPHSGQSKKYGAIDPVLTFDNDGGLVPGAFEGKLSRGVNQNVGTYAIALGSLSAGGNYVLSLAPGTVKFTIEQAQVTEITVIVDNVNKTAYEMRNAATAQAVLGWAGLPSSVSVITDGGTAMLPITWSTATAYNPKGAVYEVLGTLTGNENIDANSITKSVTVTVTPVTAANPSFGDMLVLVNSDSSATAAELGETILPAGGSITVEGESVAYTIHWNGGQTLDRTIVGNEQTFTGAISYASPPAWLTLPGSFAVSRKVTVTDKTPVTIGGITTTNKVYDGTVYAPDGTVTASDGFHVSQLEWLYESTDGAGYNSSTAPIDAGTYKLTISVPESNANYAGREEFHFIIEKRKITLNADNKTVVKGDSLPALTYTVGNLAPGEIELDALTTAPTLLCPTFDSNTPGNYEIYLTGGAAADNYTITGRTGGTLIVTKQTYTITFNLNGGTHTGGGELTQTVAEGGSATAPTVTRSGYNFTGWDKAFDYVTSNLTVTAGWSRKGGGGGGSSDDSGSSSVIVTSPAPDKPNTPTQGEIKVDGKVSNGSAAVTITKKSMKYAYEKALAEAKKNGSEQNGITLVLRVNTGKQTVNNITFNLPKTVQDYIIGKKIVNTVVVVKNPDITISMDLATVREINRQSNADVNITVTRVNNGNLTGNAKAVIGSRPVFNLEASYGNGKLIENFGAGSVSVAIPYPLGINEQVGNVQAVYADKNGKVQWLLSSVYDSVNEVLRFSTSHFSVYGVGYKKDTPTFTDVGNHWAKDDIAFVVNRGLFSGTSKTTFSPNTAMTRGMFVTALGRLADADESVYKKSSFTDVKNDAYYMGYIEWASKNSIVNGVGNKQFAPDQSITREQMAVIMSNYAKTIGYTLPKVHAENTFADNAKISAYAKEAVKQMQMAGAISGKNGNLFDPQGTATRAEVSAVLRRFVELAISSDTAQGWTMNDSGKWMYYENGKPVTGKKDIDGSTYTFDQYGVTADIPKNLRYTTYTVEKGDSFWRIARKLGCTMSELERLNNKSRFSLIFPSEVLRVPEK
ncbi:S-layer homology domain-containing protein [Brassicibacter mesophilus]|uniref:S-layer homology domain-containing protein n=1 Tax=Brassicibacter mesophilus TaxID=745119 RepID=UPI003D232E49